MLTDDLQMAFDSPAGVQALQFMRDLVDKYNIVPPGSESASWDDTASMRFTPTPASASTRHNKAPPYTVQRRKIQRARPRRSVLFGRDDDDVPSA